jgi:Na+-driven multidrug efflux pump
VSSAIGSSLREIGETKAPLYISAACTVVNTVGNYILIYGNFGAPRLEVTGAAIATIIARWTDMVIYIGYAHRRKAPFYSSFRRLFQVHWPLVRQILSRSVMILFSEISWIGSETVMMALYNGRGGAEVVAGMSAGWAIANILMLVNNGTFTTAAVLIGGSLGSGRLDEARKRARWLMSGWFIAGIVIALLGAGASRLLIPLVFSNLSDAARSIAFGLVAVICCYFPIWAILNSQFATCRAGGDTLQGIVTDGVVNTFLVIPGSFVLAWLTNVSPVVMFALVKLTDFPKLVIAGWFYKKERWVRNLTK